MKHCKTARRGDEGANLINVACVLIMTHGGGKGKAGESLICCCSTTKNMFHVSLECSYVDTRKTFCELLTSISCCIAIVSH